jgi:hypothetical protein
MESFKLIKNLLFSLRSPEASLSNSCFELIYLSTEKKLERKTLKGWHVMLHDIFESRIIWFSRKNKSFFDLLSSTIFIENSFCTVNWLKNQVFTHYKLQIRIIIMLLSFTKMRSLSLNSSNDKCILVYTMLNNSGFLHEPQLPHEF